MNPMLLGYCFRQGVIDELLSKKCKKYYFLYDELDNTVKTACRREYYKGREWAQRYAEEHGKTNTRSNAKEQKGL